MIQRQRKNLQSQVEVIDARLGKRLAKIGNEVQVVPYVSDQTDYLSADARINLSSPRRMHR